MKIKNITISNFGSVKTQTTNTAQNIVLLDNKHNLLTVLKWFMNIEIVDSLKKMKSLLNENSAISIEFIDAKNNTIRYEETGNGKGYNGKFTIGNFATSNFLTDAFFEHFFPQEYSGYTFLDLEQGYSDSYIAKHVEKLNNLVKEGFSNRPPHMASVNEVITFCQNYSNNFKKIPLNENLYFTMDGNYKFVIQDVNNKNVVANAAISTLFNILCFIYTNQFFSKLKEYDGELESAYSPLLIKGNILENEKDVVLKLLKEQKRQVFILC